MGWAYLGSFVGSHHPSQSFTGCGCWSTERKAHPEKLDLMAAASASLCFQPQPGDDLPGPQSRAGLSPGALHTSRICCISHHY